MRVGFDRKASGKAGRRTVVLAATAVVMSTAFLQLGVSTASADTPGGTDDAISQEFVQTVGETVIDNQDTLSTYRSWMIDQPGFDDSGYVGSVDDLEHKATAVLWSGPHTALLSAILAEGQRRGIAVTVQQRTYSLQQLDAAVDTVWQQADGGGWAGFAISSIEEIGVTEDGLVVNGTYTDVPEAQRAPQVRSGSTTVDGVPVRIVPGVAAENADGRDNDTAPFGAGDYMIDNNHTCSTGFGIKIDKNPETTTARHCTEAHYHARNGSASYGGVLGNSGSGGARVLSGNSSAMARTGPYNSTNNAKKVIGFEDLGLGDFVCTSGGNSGEHCHIKVTDLRVSFNDGKGRFPTIKGVQQKNGEIATIQGDSGGPVLSLKNGKDGQVRAAGMIQAIETPFHTGKACGPVFDAGSNECSKTVLFSSMRVIVKSIKNASLNTG